MAEPDRALIAREQQLQEALKSLSDQHGDQSETVALIRDRLEAVQREIEDQKNVNTNSEAHTGNIVESLGAPTIRDSAVMYVLLGGTLIFAFGGMSTMFVLMLAAKW